MCCVFSRGDDVDYQENFLKPELIKFLVRLYASKFEENDPAKISLRDKILECAKLASEVSPLYNQDGQSRGQRDWVHIFPEPVKSFITFVILSQISCSLFVCFV